MNPQLLLLAFSLVLFVLSALPHVAPYWNRLVSLGLACFVASLLIGGVLK